MKLVIFIVIFFPLLAFAKGYGIVTMVRGKAIHLSAAGQRNEIKKGDKIFEMDTINTLATSVVRIVMMDTNVIDIYPNSNLLIRQYVYDPKKDNKNVRLEISAGSIKSDVRQRYDNIRNKYEVKTPVIVAGVRGTIFFADHESASDVSRIRTLEGEVMVGRLDSQEQVKEFYPVRAKQMIQMDRQTKKPEVKDIPTTELETQKENDKKDGFTRMTPKGVESDQDSRKPRLIESSGSQPSSRSSSGRGAPALNESQIVNGNPDRVGASDGKNHRILDSTSTNSSDRLNNSNRHGIQSGGGDSPASPAIRGEAPALSESPFVREPASPPVAQPTPPPISPIPPAYNNYEYNGR